MSRRVTVKAPLPCIVCGFQPEATEASHEGKNWPYAATAFQTHGHYGSTIFDPMDGTFIEINVCDTCLRRKADEGVIAEGRDSKPRINGSGARVGMEPIRPKQQPKLKEWQP